MCVQHIYYGAELLCFGVYTFLNMYLTFYTFLFFSLYYKKILYYKRVISRARGLYGKISDRGLDSTERAKRGPYKKDRGLIFSRTDRASEVNNSFII